MIRDSSPYNDTLSLKATDDTTNTTDNKGLSMTISPYTNQDSSPYNDILSLKDGNDTKQMGSL